MLFFLLISGTKSLNSQIYKFSFQKNKKEFAASMIVLGGLQVYNIMRPVRLIDNIDQLDPSKIWQLDRSAIGQQSRSWKDVSDGFLYSSFAVPLLLGLSTNQAEDKLINIVCMGYYGFAMQYSINTAVKIWAHRPRPYVYDEGARFLTRQQSKADTESLYSGHTSTTTYFYFFTAKVFSDLYPKSKFKPLVWSMAATISAITGFARYKSGNHFPTDVILGYIMGSSFGILIPSLYKKQENLNVTTNGSGVYINYSF